MWVATAKYYDKLNLPSVEGKEELATSGIETLHFKGKAGEKTLFGAAYVNFAFIQIKSKVNKKSRSRILTR